MGRTINLSTLKILLLLWLLSSTVVSYTQLNTDSVLGKIDPQKWAASVERKVEKLQEKIISKSTRALENLQKQEEKIYGRMLNGKDSLIAKAALTDLQTKYQSLKDKISNPNVGNTARQYIPGLDTLNTTLKFLGQNGVSGKVKDALSKTEALQAKFQQAEEIRKFVRERRQQLQGQLEKLGLVKQLKKYNKTAYYYSEQIKEFKEILKDPKKKEQKAIELLSKTKLFKDFMRKNSMLASMFRLPGDSNDPTLQASLTGLQSRAQVNGLIQERIGSGGPNAMAQFRQNVSSAQNQIDQLKNKMTRSGGNSDDIMPEGFKPNDQKTKSFWKRIEVGANTQSQKATNFFPVTTDLGLSLGYKLNGKSIVGIGASYKVGWGRGWNHIRFTSEGMGLRAFVDWKVPFGSSKSGMIGNLWISGGYEQNYRTAFNTVYQLRDLNAWQRSGLIGLSKVVNVKSKFFKKTKVQAMWDFLSYQQIPRTQAIIFRYAYNF